MVLLCPQRAPATTDPCRTPKLGAGPDSLNVIGNCCDVMTGNIGNDVLHGDVGEDNLLDLSGDNALYGHFGADHLQRGASDYQLFGGQGADKLEGDSEDDAL